MNSKQWLSIGLLVIAGNAIAMDMPKLANSPYFSRLGKKVKDSIVAHPFLSIGIGLGASGLCAYAYISYVQKNQNLLINAHNPLPASNETLNTNKSLPEQNPLENKYGYLLEIFENNKGRALIDALKDEDNNFVEFILTKENNQVKEFINYIDNTGNTPLIKAIEKHNAKLVQLLLAYGADPQLVVPNYFSNALKYAKSNIDTLDPQRKFAAQKVYDILQKAVLGV